MRNNLKQIQQTKPTDFQFIENIKAFVTNVLTFLMNVNSFKAIESVFPLKQQKY